MEPSARPRSRSPQAASSTATATATGLRRAATTLDDAWQVRQRVSSPRRATTAIEPPSLGRRRSSTFSELSFGEARKVLQSSTDDLLLPRATGHETIHEGSHWDSAPLAFALLPAIGGMIFTNGSSVVTDVMLLSLAAIFLNWSVRLPWTWYHAAQSIRVREERRVESAVEDTDDDVRDDDDDEHFQDSRTSLDDVPEDTEPPQPTPQPRSLETSALSELYLHEVMALVSCLIAPVLGAYLLHTIRTQLSRPSEGLVSNYNLTIFLLASELRPLSHLAKLVQARTLHLQRLVHQNPYAEQKASATVAAMEEVKQRIEYLESHSLQKHSPLDTPEEPSLSSKHSALLLSEMRRTLQPELDALNRAVRRYEKRAALQSMQTESRLRDLDARLNDAISLAAAAAKSSQAPSLFSALLDTIARALLLPVQTASALIKIPFTLLSSAGALKRRVLHADPPAEKDYVRRNGRGTGRLSAAQARAASEKISGSRLGKR